MPQKRVKHSFGLLLTEGQAKYNCRLKVFGKQWKYTVFSRPVFNPYKHEVVKKKVRVTKDISLGQDRIQRPDSTKRAKDRATEICFANNFQYFITFTLDQAKIDRYDISVISKKMKQWLKNRVKRDDFKYIIFPEKHVDGAIHFHGLCSGDLKLKDSGKVTKNGDVIYNAGSWKYGFSSVVKIEKTYEKVVSYVSKYITKEKNMIFGSYYFAGGKGLKREVETRYYNVDYDKVQGKEYYISGADMAVKYLTLDISNVSRETLWRDKE